MFTPEYVEHDQEILSIVKESATEQLQQFEQEFQSMYQYYGNVRSRHMLEVMRESVIAHKENQLRCVGDYDRYKREIPQRKIPLRLIN